MFFKNLIFPLIFTIIFAFPQKPADNPEKSLENCKNQENATDEDLIFLTNGTLPESRVEKCVSACLMENSGLVKCLKLNKHNF